MSDVTILHHTGCSTSRYAVDEDLEPDDFTAADAVADLLVEHPRLMQRPVLMRGDRAIIGRPKDRVQAFLA